MTVSPIPSIPSTPLPGERVPLPEGLTRLADGALRADGVDGVAVINPASGSDSCAVSVETGLRVLQALGGTYLPTVGPAAPSAPSPAVERIPVGRRAPLGADSPTEPVPEIPMPSRSEVLAKASPGPSAASAAGTQEPLPDMPRTSPAKKKSRRRSRRSVPSWDEIVFGARPE